MLKHRIWHVAPNRKIIIVTRQINVYVRVVATFQKLQTEFLKFQEQ